MMKLRAQDSAACYLRSCSTQPMTYTLNPLYASRRPGPSQSEPCQNLHHHHHHHHHGGFSEGKESRTESQNALTEYELIN